jgi:hypothetical protein
MDFWNSRIARRCRAILRERNPSEKNYAAKTGTASQT